MPRLNRKPKKKTSGYTRWDIFYLKFGHDYFDSLLPGDTEAIVEAWEIFRAEILKDWLHDSPGTRPWCWWEHDAPERRFRLNGVHPFNNPQRRLLVEVRETTQPGFQQRAMKLWFGVPSLLICPDDFEAIYETELQYLTRLNLLLPLELEVLP